MDRAIIIIQVISLVVMITAILLQQKGTGLSGMFGGSTFYQTRRGAEKFIFYLTIASAFVFFLVTIWQIFSK